MKKGFTLIELLAVIVILAIIALIATPIVLNIINDTKESAILRSADFYLDAVELSIAQRVLENNSIEDRTYQIMSNGNICIGTYNGTTCTGEEMIVEVNGEKPKSGEITIGSGEVTETTLNISSKDVVYNTETKKFEIQEEPSEPEVASITQDYSTIGNPIYYNVTTGAECGAPDHAANAETNAGCMKFYVLDNTDTDTIDLISSERFGPFQIISDESEGNYDSTIAECSTGACTSIAANKLKELTASWNAAVVGNDFESGNVSFAGAKARPLTQSEWNLASSGAGVNPNYGNPCNPEDVSGCTNSENAGGNSLVWLYGEGVTYNQYHYVYPNYVWDTAVGFYTIEEMIPTYIYIRPVITLKKG